MCNETDAGKGEIRAAGGLIWKSSPHGREIAVIYRARYGDWTLPKGKLKSGEDWQEAAVREVKEETGCSVEVGEFAGEVRYEIKGKQKVVRFWNMTPTGECQFQQSEEVEKVVWLPAAEALMKLDYGAEKELLKKCSGYLGA